MAYKTTRRGEPYDWAFYLRAGATWYSQDGVLDETRRCIRHVEHRLSGGKSLRTDDVVRLPSTRTYITLHKQSIDEEPALLVRAVPRYFVGVRVAPPRTVRTWTAVKEAASECLPDMALEPTFKKWLAANAKAKTASKTAKARFPRRDLDLSDKERRDIEILKREMLAPLPKKPTKKPLAGIAPRLSTLALLGVGVALAYALS